MFDRYNISQLSHSRLTRACELENPYKLLSTFINFQGPLYNTNDCSTIVQIHCLDRYRIGNRMERVSLSKYDRDGRCDIACYCKERCYQGSEVFSILLNSCLLPCYTLKAHSQVVTNCKQVVTSLLTSCKQVVGKLCQDKQVWNKLLTTCNKLDRTIALSFAEVLRITLNTFSFP